MIEDAIQVIRWCSDSKIENKRQSCKKSGYLSEKIGALTAMEIESYQTYLD